MRRLSAIVLLILLPMGAAAADPVPNVKETINRGLAFLAKDNLAWKEKRQCAECHHAPFTIWALNEGKKQGRVTRPCARRSLSSRRFSGRMGPGRWYRGRSCGMGSRPGISNRSPTPEVPGRDGAGPLVAGRGQTWQNRRQIIGSQTAPHRAPAAVAGTRRVSSPAFSPASIRSSAS